MATVVNEVKRFVKWLIDEDLAFTHIDEAVRAFKEVDRQPRSVCHYYCTNEEAQPYTWDLTNMGASVGGDHSD